MLGMEKKKVILCFYKGDISDDIYILEDLDSKGFEVHLFNDIDESSLKYDVLLDIIKNLYGSKNDEYDIYVSSNVKEFIMLQYILYSHWISGTLYINNSPAYFEIDKLYKEILKKEIHIGTSDFYVLKKEENIFNNYLIFSGDFESKKKKKDMEDKIYILDGIKHVFSIKDTKETNMVSLDNSKNSELYEYHFDLEYLQDYISLIKYYSNYVEEFIELYNGINLKLTEFKDKVLEAPNFEKNIIKFKLENELYNNYTDDKYKIFLSSILLNIFNSKKYLNFLLKLLIKSTDINKYNRFFVYCQCITYVFVHKDISDENINIMLENLYEKIFDEFSLLYKDYGKVSKENIDNDLVFVNTSQFLSIEHSPTKLTLDVCYNLIKNLNKKVLLINMQEILTSKGLIPMKDIRSGNIINKYDTINTIKYKDVEISFYQPQVSMPDDKEIINILNMVQKYKPGLILNIGTTLVGDLCTKIIPTVTLPTSGDGYSKSTFYIVNDERQYKEYTKKHNRNSEGLIISKFQFELKHKKNTFTKKQLGIPENKFIISVIGNRLNDEINEELLDVLDKSCRESNAYIVFISKFDFNTAQVSKYKNLINNYKNMGYQEDLLAIIENTDIYLNPSRSGGGTSAIYSLYAGKPVVTLNYGDVALNVGEEFCVDNYNEMLSIVDKYYIDTEFYNKKSCIAKKMAMELIDMDTYLKNIYKQAIDSNLYYI